MMYNKQMLFVRLFAVAVVNVFDVEQNATVYKSAKCTANFAWFIWNRQSKQMKSPLESSAMSGIKREQKFSLLNITIWCVFVH